MRSNPLLGLEADAIIDLPARTLWSISNADVEEYQLWLLRKRFDALRGRISTLRKLVELQGVRDVPPLFQHTTYKSYPMSLLEKGRYPALTRWLSELTARPIEGRRKVGKPGECVALYDEMLSADVSSLAGRVKTAEEKGELDKLKITSALLEKFKQSMSRQSTAAAKLEEFFPFILDKCRGGRVMTAAVVPYLWAWTV